MGTMTRTIGSYAVIAALGAIVALVGGGAHRSYAWIGLSLCLLLVAVASVFARAWHGYVGLAVLASVWFTMTGVLAGEGPGGSALIPTDALGLAWVIGAAIVMGLTAMVPRRWLVGPGEAIGG